MPVQVVGMSPDLVLRGGINFFCWCTRHERSLADQTRVYTYPRADPTDIGIVMCNSIPGGLGAPFRL